MTEGFRPNQENLSDVPGEPITGAVFELDQELRSSVSAERVLEMDRYGRTATYDRISHYLTGDVREAFLLVNYVPAIVDDEIDRDGNIRRLDDAKAILSRSFGEADPALLEGWEEGVFDLGRVLSKLNQDGFGQAEKVFAEVINYWDIEIQNLRRMGKTLGAAALDDLNLQIGRSVGLQFLYLLTPQLDENSRELVASSYGFAIKLADNLSDLDEDIRQGYINISREDADRYNLDPSALGGEGVRAYMKSEWARVKQCYQASDEILKNALGQNPACREGLILFKDVAHSWLKQASEICAED